MAAATEKNAEASGEAPATPVTLTARAAEKVKKSASRRRSRMAMRYD